MRKGSAIAAGGILAVAGIAPWILVATGSQALLGWSEGLPRSLLPLIGVPLGAGLVFLAEAALRPADSDGAERSGGAEPMLAAAAAGAAVLLGIGALNDRISPLGAALVLMLGTGALLALSRALRDLKEGQGVAFESHWGGLAGGMGGWRLSSATVSSLLAIILIGAVVGAAMTAEAGGDEPAGNGASNGASVKNKADAGASATRQEGNSVGGGGSSGGAGAGGSFGGGGATGNGAAPDAGGNGASPAAPAANTSSPAAEPGRRN